MQKCETTKKKVCFKPFKEFIYQSPSKGLSKLINKDDFFLKCQAWKDRKVGDGEMGDVYDGNMWQNFNRCNKNFLDSAESILFALNIDWFQPFEHSTHSVGVMYLTVLNLPREMRNREENVIVVGIIPGPKEPKKTCNSFLRPLVGDLLELWDGLWLGEGKNRRKFRAALLCVCCDVPATRKVGGFMGHNAHKGCNKCLLSFSTKAFGEKPDFSNFEKASWPERNNSEQRRYAKLHNEANTIKEKKEIEKKYGARFSVLHNLPYFDSVRSYPVDPMHNLFLGTAKHVIQMWKGRRF